MAGSGFQDDSYSLFMDRVNDAINEKIDELNQALSKRPDWLIDLEKKLESFNTTTPIQISTEPTEKLDWQIDLENKLESFNKKPDWLIEFELNQAKNEIPVIQVDFAKIESERIERERLEKERIENERIENERLSTVWTSQNILDEIIKKFKK